MSDDAEFREITDPMRIAELVAEGVRPLNAALEVGWSPSRLTREMKDPEFADLIEAAEMQATGQVEHALFIRARNGNVPAAMFWLLNRDPDRWRDIKRIEIKQDTTVTINAVATAVEAARRALDEIGPVGLQAFHVHAIEAVARE